MHYFDIQFLIALALVKFQKTSITTYDLNEFRVQSQNKITKLNYMFDYITHEKLEQLKLVFPDFFEVKEGIIYAKKSLDEITKYFVAYLPNDLLQMIFEDNLNSIENNLKITLEIGVENGRFDVF